MNKALPQRGSGEGAFLHATLRLSYATSAGLKFGGQNIIDYDLNRNTLNGQPYSPQDPTSLSLTMDVYIDRTSVEVFIDDGLYSYALPFRGVKSEELRVKNESNISEDMSNSDSSLFTLHSSFNFEFWGSEITVTDLQLDAVGSIWE